MAKLSEIATITALDSKKAEVTENSIIIVRIGSDAGRVFLYNEAPEKYLGKVSAVINPNDNKIEIYNNLKVRQEEIKKLSKGKTMISVSLKDLEDIEIEM